MGGVLTEAEIKRNPHPDFKKTEASRPQFDPSSAGFDYVQTPNPRWEFGSGANSTLNNNDDDTPSSKSKTHITINPYAENRPPAFNYKLLISAIVPRPIAFISTLSAPDSNGDRTTNLAPMSYFNFVNHDPPMLVVGFASPTKPRDKINKDTLRNILDTGECVINIISEGFVEAANSTSVNAPPGVSEWAVSGLTPVYDCEQVRPARVGEAVFSVECKLESSKEFESRSKPGTGSGTMVVLEGVRFWCREDAINEERNLVDPAILRPVSRLGGITYGRVTQGIEIPRPDFEKDLGGIEAYKKLEKQRLGTDDDRLKPGSGSESKV